MYRIFVAVERKEDVNTLKDTFREGKYQLVFAGSYSHAMSLWYARELFDLAILDANAPSLNGWALLENIRQNSSREEFPILMLLNNREHESICKAFDLGASDVLHSPIHYCELLARVENQLAQSATPNLSATPNPSDIKSQLARNKLLSIISHDLRNPLGAIKIIAGMLRNASQVNDRKDMDELFSVLEKTIEGNFRLLENMSKWARMQAGKTVVQPSELLLAPLVDDVVEEFKEILNGKGVRIDNRVNDDELVLADPDLLKYILQNLVSNAIKYSHPAKGLVVIEANLSSQGANVQIKVRDNGIGVNPVILDKLFRLDGNISSLPGTAGEEGTGLGLIICSEFAQAMKGALAVELVKEGGTEFILTLPVSE